MRRVRVKSLTPEILRSLFRTAANNIRMEVDEKTKSVYKKRNLYENMKEMSSAVDEMKELKEIHLNQEELYVRWWRNKFEEENIIINQFEKDDVFYINKKEKLT
jgi:hypothetical protein